MMVLILIWDKCDGEEKSSSGSCVKLIARYDEPRHKVRVINIGIQSTGSDIRCDTQGVDHTL